MIRLIIFIFLILTCVSYSKVPQTKEQPIVIEAQKLSYDDREKVAVYIGSVVAQHGKTVIRGDKLTIYFDKTGKEVKKVVVTGNVYIKDERGQGWCNQLIYYPFQRKAVLIGKAKLKQGKNFIVGDRIVAYGDGRVEVIGKEKRVKTVIFPGEGSGSPGLKSP